MPHARARADDLVLALEDEVLDAWSQRFDPEERGGAVVRMLVAEVLSSVGTAGGTSAVLELAQALGVLRAHEGRDAVSLVEDVQALRSAIWERLATHDALVGDLPALLGHQLRLQDAADAVLRGSVSGWAEESQRVLRTAATRDPLTGLLNRASLQEALRRELAAREPRPSLLLIDLDGFKQVNDQHGHLAGDEVLVRVAQVLAGACRSGDVVARLGGDEFAVVMPRTDLTDATRLARRMVAAVRTDDRLRRGPGADVRLSVGVCRPAPDAEVTTGDVIAAADEAMYAAKRAGGDTFVTYSRPGRSG